MIFKCFIALALISLAKGQNANAQAQVQQVGSGYGDALGSAYAQNQLGQNQGVAGQMQPGQYQNPYGQMQPGQYQNPYMQNQAYAMEGRRFYGGYAYAPPPAIAVGPPILGPPVLGPPVYGGYGIYRK